MVHEPGSLHAQLQTQAVHAWRLYSALELAIPHRPVSAGERIRQRRINAPIPWNAVAAELTLEFHAEIRRLECHLKERITGGYPRRRGPSHANTRFAVDSVVKLCETCDTGTVTGVLNYFSSWARRADAHFNPENRLHRLPRQPGENAPRCPYCTHDTLRWNPNDGRTICLHPQCLNANGVRPRWTAEFTLIDGELVFHWNELEAA